MKISINTPCHEDWGKMQVGNGYKFCNSCQKNVVDFTQKSDVEIIQYFTQFNSNSTCGRFNNSQLNTELPLYTAFIQHKQQYHTKNNIWGMLISFGSMLLASCSNSTKQNVTKNSTIDTIKVDSSAIQIKNHDTLDIKLGEVIPELKEPIEIEQIEPIPLTGLVAIEPIKGKVAEPFEHLLGDTIAEPLPMPKATFDFDSFINKNFNFPNNYNESHTIEVNIEAMINESGDIINVKLLNSSGNIEVDKEILRVLNLQPKYIPAESNGIKISKNIRLKVNL